LIQFAGVGVAIDGRNTVAVSEPYLSRTTVTLNSSTQQVGVTSGASVAAIYASSGGAKFWYNTFPSSASTNVVSGGFPDRCFNFAAEGDYDLVALPRTGVIGIRG
jgi:hypothetical protein